MKKYTIILFLIALFYNIPSFSQTVTINSLIVNNVSMNSKDPINLGNSSISNISFSTEVILPSVPSDSYPGTINVYYQKNKNSVALTPTGGNGGNLLFLGGTSRNRSFVITLDAAQFDLTGGFLYSEYKSSSELIYKSSPIPIVKTAPLPPNFPPSDPNYASQIVPYGGTPLLPNYPSYLNIASQDWVNNGNTSIIWQNELIMYKSDVIRQRTIFTNGTVKLEPQKMNITVSKFFPLYTTRFSVNNMISNDQYIPIGQNPQTIIGNQASESHYDSGNNKITNLLSNYQWQSRVIYPFWWVDFNYGLSLYGWYDIPGANQQNYTPPTASRGIEYRRLVLENPSETSINRNCASSNSVRIIPLNNLINPICCNQTIEYGSTTNPQPLTSAMLNGSIYYQWQYSYDNIYWVDYFENSHSNNYSFIRNSRGSNPSYFRLMTLDYSTNLYNLSNVVRIIYNERPRKIKNIEKQDNNLDNSIILFPNPTSSIINLSGINNLSPTKINIIDMEGKVIISRVFNKSMNGSIQLDISSVATGIYTLELENKNVKTTKKLIKN
jgi:hypothetical protein